MKHIGMTDLKFDVGDLRAQLRLCPEVWNTITHRTSFATSPHREVDDVWVRYNALEHFASGVEQFNGPHDSVWYPVVSKIPAAKLLSLELFQLTDASSIGGVLVTRVPAGKQVYPHVDVGWHARYYEKFVIQVEGNSEQAFCYEDGQLSAGPGECYWFDNAFPHWVTNGSREDRVSLIVCLRRTKCH